jgi:MoxR-like ATPase
MGVSFKRMQCTPDLLPNDVTGVSIFNQQSRQFEFMAGPAFAHILLADEINRATPRTQAALLEAMGERQVTVDGVTRPLARPFMVLATENPIEYEGTFPLPEAQLDRFLLKLQPGLPGQCRAEEKGHVAQPGPPNTPSRPWPWRWTASQIPRLAEQIWDVHVDDTLRDYIVRWCRPRVSTPT